MTTAILVCNNAVLFSVYFSQWSMPHVPFGAEIFGFVAAHYLQGKFEKKHCGPFTCMYVQPNRHAHM